MENNLVENDEGLYKSNCRKDKEEKKMRNMYVYSDYKTNQFLTK